MKSGEVERILLCLGNCYVEVKIGVLMGKYDSTKTRVIPLFDYIGSDKQKLNRMLSLINPEVKIESSIISTAYGENEKAIPPSPSLLKWCIRNFRSLNQKRNELSKEKSPKT